MCTYGHGIHIQGTLTYSSLLSSELPTSTTFPRDWAAANGGVTDGGLRGVWPPFLEIGLFWSLSPFICLFRPFLEGPKSTWEIRKMQEKAFLLRYPPICLNPHVLNPYLRHPKQRRWHFFGTHPSFFGSTMSISSATPYSEKRLLFTSLRPKNDQF